MPLAADFTRLARTLLLLLIAGLELSVSAHAQSSPTGRMLLSREGRVTVAPTAASSAARAASGTHAATPTLRYASGSLAATLTYGVASASPTGIGPMGSSIVWHALDGTAAVLHVDDGAMLTIAGSDVSANASPSPAASQPAAGAAADAPTEFGLSAIEPNPVVTGSRARFSVPSPGRATLELFDVAGRRVATLLDGPATPGAHEVALPGRPRAAGLYRLRLTFAPADGSGIRRVARPVVVLP